MVHESCRLRQLCRLGSGLRNNQFHLPRTNGSIIWPIIFGTDHQIHIAHTSFKWANLASHNAGVTTAIVGISKNRGLNRKLYSLNDDNETVVKIVANINAYLVPADNIIVNKRMKPLSGVPEMDYGNKPTDGGNLLLTPAELVKLNLSAHQKEKFVRKLYGSAEFIRGIERHCLWIGDADIEEARAIKSIDMRLLAVEHMRSSSSKEATRRALVNLINLMRFDKKEMNRF